MAIDLDKMQLSDWGRWVQYMAHSGPELDLAPPHYGLVKNWNEKFIFVVFAPAAMSLSWQNCTAAATKPEDLTWVQPHERTPRGYPLEDYDDDERARL